MVLEGRVERGVFGLSAAVGARVGAQRHAWGEGRSVPGGACGEACEGEVEV